MKTNSLLIWFSIMGIILLGISLFFGHAGLTFQVSWSLHRLSLLILSLVFLLFALIYSLYKDKITDATNKAGYAIESNPITHWWVKAQLVGYDEESKLKQIHQIVGIFSFLIILIYLWFVSAGQWIAWPQTTNYYDQIASSFEKGQLFLLATPSSALLALSNPYDPGIRGNIPFPIDFSLFNGKFYLYFGPVPAIVLAIIKLLLPIEIGDQYVVFVSILGIYIFQCLFILSIWRKYFRDFPIWMILICIPLIGLINPFLYMLVTARIYEAAITAGQFFFMGGLYFAVMAFDKPLVSLSRLGLAGLFWASAIASRMILSLPVGFMALMTLFWIIITSPKIGTRQTIQGTISFVLPFALGIACLGWYNHARFGSVFETGINYQLTATNLQKNHNDLFTLANVPQNLYNYLINPPKILNTFPYISATSANKKSSVVPFIKLPAIYNGEQITGLVYSAPFILFAIIPFFTLFSKTSNQQYSNPLFGKNNKMDFIKWIFISLIGSFLLAFIALLLFFWATMRYMTDFIPSLILLSIIGFWQGYRFFTQRPIQLILYSFTGFCLACISIFISSFLTFSINLWWLNYFS